MSDDTSKRVAMDGMTAAASAAYALSDVAMVFPITPASRMAETVERWSVEGKRNLFGNAVDVFEMQSEKGVAGALHGSLVAGALATTFTASQGLLLMIPNLYRMAGDLLPAVIHVTARSLATHALSIFGDHQDVMAVRGTGVCMLASANAQECMDLGLVAHLSAIDCGVPFVHFFDGFRTSDEVETVEPVGRDVMGKLLNWDRVREFRASGLDPAHPIVRGAAQNPDIYFQNREAANLIYDSVPGAVEANMRKLEDAVGRHYGLFDYVGASDATRVVAAMASSCDCLEETVRHLVDAGEKVGLVKVRLYRPFSVEHFLSALPDSVRIVAALDRTKEPGSIGEPLYLDVRAALSGARSSVQVIGGRYGLSSKEFAPAHAKAVFDNMAACLEDDAVAGAGCGAASGKRRFTVGMVDDLTHLSLPVARSLSLLPNGVHQCIFYGFGSDGTVGATKMAARLMSERAGKFVQQYSIFDSKKSGGLTACHLRFGDERIVAPYLIDGADYVACNKDSYVQRGYPLLDRLRDGGSFVLNCAWSAADMERELPACMRREIARKGVRLFAIDAAGRAARFELGAKINLVMLAAFFKVSGALDYADALEGLKEQVRLAYASKGDDVVACDIAALDAVEGALVEIDYPKEWADAGEGEDEGGGASALDVAGGGAGECGGEDTKASGPFATPGSCEAFVERVFWPLERLRGDDVPTSALDPCGIAPLGTSALEKRTVAFEIPQWDPSKCIQCLRCSLMCPHAAIRPYFATQDELAASPDGYETAPSQIDATRGMSLRIQVYPQDCVGCSSCVSNCPAPDGALSMRQLREQLAKQRENLEFAQRNVSGKGHLADPSDVLTTQLQRPLLEFSGCCAGCGETPYVKLLTQLFGERLVIANATGCSSIWGAYVPSVPYAIGEDGRGPAWANSLFEDNAEFAYGIFRGVAVRHALGRGSQVRESVWAVGGDGWAYDIDFDGLDHVLASGEDINVLVLDTECYSNTGGEASKASQLGSVSGFTLDGKPTPKKPLASMCARYGCVYVAQVCLGADAEQAISALIEADAYEGPSVVVALCPCISWGIRGGMAASEAACKEAVASGYWPLFRFDPRRAEVGEVALVVDSEQPDGTLSGFLAEQVRYSSLASRDPARAKRFAGELARDAQRGFERLSRT